MRSDADGDHVLRNLLAEANAGIVALGHNVSETVVDDDLDLDIGVPGRFQTPNRLAQRRLRNAQLRRGFREAESIAYASSDIIELAAKYTAGIVQNHPFVDGNKRTAFVIGVLFLELDDYRFTASEEAAAQAVLELAAGTVDEAGFCEFIRANARRRK